MVSLRLSAAGARACRAATLSGALILAAACRREAAPQATNTPSSPDERIAETVRAKYHSSDAEAAGAWVWTAPDTTHYVLIDVESAVQGVVQGRAELWMASETDAALFGRSETLPSVATIGAYEFADLTGDKLPDLFGFVADSDGVAFPVFFPGSRPGMSEEIALAAPGWVFSIDEAHPPAVFRDAGRPCALQIWVEAPAADNAPAGWRWLVIQQGGRLAAPVSAQPSCAAGATPGVQPGASTP